MAQSVAEQQTQQWARIGDDRNPRELARLVRVAVGRLGGSISPWLDEGLLIDQGLSTLLELSGDPSAVGQVEISRVVSGMRTWARASSWYRAALPCRIAPLCASVAARVDAQPPEDRIIAQDLGIDPGAAPDRYVEAGLVFAVSPELLLPALAPDARGAALSDAIATLPIDQRRLLTLYFEDGLSFPEMAHLLDISPERAQQLYGRAATIIRARVFDHPWMRGVSG
jgi:hypothetical protein